MYYENQIIVSLHYKGLSLDSELRLDVLVEDLLCVELKAQETVLPVHEAILMSYMQMLERPKGLMLNFHCVNIFREGQKTFVNSLYAKLPEE